MSEFKKGLVVGMLVILGCGTFIAKTSNITSYNRYEPVSHGKLLFMLDTWKGDLYGRSMVSGSEHWTFLTSLKPKDENEKEDD